MYICLYECICIDVACVCYICVGLYSCTYTYIYTNIY